MCVRGASNELANPFAQTTSLRPRDLAYDLDAMRARESNMISKEDRANFRSCTLVAYSHVRGRTIVFEQSRAMLVHLSSNAWHASSLSLATLDHSISHSRSFVIRRTKSRIDRIDALARDSMPTFLSIGREF